MATLTETTKKPKHHSSSPKRKTAAYKRKFAKVMREAYKGRLHSGKSGKKVTSAAQAKAIAHSEAMKAGKKKN
ncbi:MAG: hypothetical protein IT462_11175 [Planctomycetes bacterium]|nr:hypothetical protein [Planctomycetota bacterium]